MCVCMHIHLFNTLKLSSTRLWNYFITSGDWTDLIFTWCACWFRKHQGQPMVSHSPSFLATLQRLIFQRSKWRWNNLTNRLPFETNLAFGAEASVLQAAFLYNWFGSASSLNFRNTENSFLHERQTLNLFFPGNFEVKAEIITQTFILHYFLPLL